MNFNTELTKRSHKYKNDPKAADALNESYKLFTAYVQQLIASHQAKQQQESSK